MSERGDEPTRTRGATVASELPLGSLSAAVRRRQVLSFLVVAFVWTWIVAWLVRGTLAPSSMLATRVLTAPAAWGPLVGAAFVTWASGGNLREWAGQVTEWRVKPKWYLVAFLLPIAAGEVPNLLYALAGVPLRFPRYPVGLYALQFVWVLLFTGALEEFGWRGFLQPRLQERHSALAAAIAVGVLWALWHVRLFYFGADGYADFPGYMLWVTEMAIILAWLYNATGGSLLLPMILHASNNMPSLAEPAGAVPPALDAVPVTPVVYGLVPLVLVVAYGATDLAPSRPEPPVPGAPRTGDHPSAEARSTG